MLATMLIVDHDPGITEMRQDILEMHGYRVLTATNRAQAFALLRDEPKPIDLLLVDVIMPEFSGRDFAASVQERWPECQVIFMTGYPLERLPAPGIPTRARLVSKPIVMRTLLDTVARRSDCPPIACSLDVVHRVQDQSAVRPHVGSVRRESRQLLQGLRTWLVGTAFSVQL